MKVVNYEDLSDDYRDTLTHKGEFLSPFHVALDPPKGFKFRWVKDCPEDKCKVRSFVFPKLPGNDDLCVWDDMFLVMVQEEPASEFKLPLSVKPELEKVASLDEFMDENPLVELQGFDLSEFEKREDEALAKVNNRIEFMEELNRLIDGLIKTHGLERNDWISVISELKSERSFIENRCWNCGRYNPIDKIDL